MNNPTSYLQSQTPGQTVPGGSQNINPLGGSVFSNLASTSPVVATLPGQTDGAGSYPSLNITTPGGLLGTGSTVPSSAGGFNPATGAGLGTPTSGAGLDYTALGDLQAVFGRGTGTAVGNVLGNLGTSTSTALSTMDKAAIDAAQQQYGNIEASEAARGVSADSSTAALMASDFSSQLTEGLASNAAQLGLQEENTLLSTLLGTGQLHGGDVSGWGEFSNVMQGLGGFVGQAMSAPSGSGFSNALERIAPNLFGSKPTALSSATNLASVENLSQSGLGGPISTIASDTSSLGMIPLFG
jgi:hypothetical protein